MRRRRLTAAVVAGVVVVGVVVWWATRPRGGPHPPPGPAPGEPANVVAVEPAPALELFGRVEGLGPDDGGGASFLLRMVRPEPPAAESPDAAHLRGSFEVVHIRLRPAATVADAAGPARLRDGQLVRVRSMRSQPKPSSPPVWFPDDVRVLQAPAEG